MFQITYSLVREPWETMNVLNLLSNVPQYVSTFIMQLCNTIMQYKTSYSPNALQHMFCLFWLCRYSITGLHDTREGTLNHWNAISSVLNSNFTNKKKL